MLTSKRTANQQTRTMIDELLESGVDLDQVMLLESENYYDSNQGNVKCSEILRKVAGCAVENAKMIQQARELILTIG
jgi:hypothetical protein